MGIQLIRNQEGWPHQGLGLGQLQVIHITNFVSLSAVVAEIDLIKKGMLTLRNSWVALEVWAGFPHLLEDHVAIREVGRDPGQQLGPQLLDVGV
ncbi:Hypothetical protein FKW44_018259 [Caligus rogercresseyi]|uniref:Uncharacterized protein n=1 Tax=Caligus rogercresseyi TaxID=217165 RepID=A0A7T8GU51_CALRO|nr:Hypothetical protein FKW44_018259 [Caligus rogercresseyi]